MTSLVKILLCDPKYPHNVGTAVRAASCFGVNEVVFTGERVPDPKSGSFRRGQRLPREERMRGFRDVDCWRYSSPRISPFRVIEDVAAIGLTPVCVEFDGTAEDMHWFVHPEHTLYVFGPEDGSVSQAARAACHRFVRIPTVHCVNLGAAVYLTLYDRSLKIARSELDYEGAADL